MNSEIYVEQQSLVEQFYRDLAPNATWRDAVNALKEEVAELFEAIEASYNENIDNRQHIAKEIGDVSFTLRGLALKAYIDYDKAERIVAIDNVTQKVRAESGKVQKKPNYQPPSMEAALL